MATLVRLLSSRRFKSKHKVCVFVPYIFRIKLKTFQVIHNQLILTYINHVCQCTMIFNFCCLKLHRKYAYDIYINVKLQDRFCKSFYRTNNLRLSHEYNAATCLILLPYTDIIALYINVIVYINVRPCPTICDHNSHQ
jgi:hypothetical protein